MQGGRTGTLKPLTSPSDSPSCAVACGVFDAFEEIIDLYDPGRDGIPSQVLESSDAPRTDVRSLATTV
jgi:hypothetical protein